MTVCAGRISAQFGINTGYSLNSMNYSNFGGKQSMNGFVVGFSYDLNIKNDWYVFTGLNYSQYWRTNKNIKEGMYLYNYSYRHGFMEIPIHAAFVMEVLDNLSISIEAGPKLSYALFGTQNKKGAVSEEINIYDKKNNISQFNVLAGFGFGVQYRNFRFKTAYDISLLNQYSGIGNAKANRSGLTFSLGYVF